MPTIDAARDFLRHNHRAVLVTRRKDGRLQTSPVTVGVDDGGRAVISTRAVLAKTKNLQRDPWATLLVMNDGFFGNWVQVEGHTDVVGMPDALEPLVDYYRSIAGEHPDWNEYRQAMIDQGRVLLRITIEGVAGSI